MSVRIGKLGIVRLTGDDLTDLRWACYERDYRHCVVCRRWLRFEAGEENSMHMAHVQNKRMYGDTLHNVRSKCAHCHLVLEHNPKSVPRKVK